jgi:multiple sugar transport system permease protein
MQDTTRKPNHYLPYLLSLPALLALIGIIYPFLLGVYYTFTNYVLTAPQDMRFVGLQNYFEIIGNENFWRSFRVTVVYACASVTIELVLGVTVAMMLQQSFPGVQILRSLLIVPMMIPPIVSALMWKVILLPTNQGVLNYALGLMGIQPVPWLGDTGTALLSLIIIDVWIFAPFAILIFLATLQSLPREPYEAARVDGASGWFVFRRLTLPFLTPSIILVTLFRLIDSLKIFDTIYATTKGGPANATNTLHILSYYEAIRWFNISNGMVYLFILWFLCFISCWLLTKYWIRLVMGATR